MVYKFIIKDYIFYQILYLSFHYIQIYIALCKFMIYQIVTHTKLKSDINNNVYILIFTNHNKLIENHYLYKLIIFLQIFN